MTAIPVDAELGNGSRIRSRSIRSTITSATLSSTNPNGVLILDTTQARQGETADDHGHRDRRRMEPRRPSHSSSRSGPTGAAARAES